MAVTLPWLVNYLTMSCSCLHWIGLSRKYLKGPVWIYRPSDRPTDRPLTDRQSEWLSCPGLERLPALKFQPRLNSKWLADIEKSKNYIFTRILTWYFYNNDFLWNIYIFNICYHLFSNQFIKSKSKKTFVEGRYFILSDVF